MVFWFLNSRGADIKLSWYSLSSCICDLVSVINFGKVSATSNILLPSVLSFRYSNDAYVTPSKMIPQFCSILFSWFGVWDFFCFCFCVFPFFFLFTFQFGKFLLTCLQAHWFFPGLCPIYCWIYQRHSFPVLFASSIASWFFLQCPNLCWTWPICSFMAQGSCRLLLSCRALHTSITAILNPLSKYSEMGVTAESSSNAYVVSLDCVSSCLTSMESWACCMMGWQKLRHVNL